MSNIFRIHMEYITFCIPYYGKELVHTELLTRSIESIRLYYPTNPILVCKTSDSHLPEDLSGVEVYSTFVDGSHIYGAIELLTRVCKTKHFLICHDSMFLMKPLPDSVLHKPLYPLWHFNEYNCYFHDTYIQSLTNAILIDNKDIFLQKFTESKEWNGIFGPAFGGTLETLKILWKILNIQKETIGPYLGRTGLMGAERLIAIVCIYMGLDTKESLNGNIYKHPNVFNVDVDIPDLSTVNYDSYFLKVWRKR